MRKLTQVIADEALKAVGWLLLPVFIVLCVTFVVCAFWIFSTGFWPAFPFLMLLCNALG
jgi:hypothetical protein